jgi:hypothetical protein
MRTVLLLYIQVHCLENELCCTYIKYIIGLGLWCLLPISTIFQFYVAVSFIGIRNRTSWRKPLDLSQVTDNLDHVKLHKAEVGFELTTLVLINTDCTN